MREDGKYAFWWDGKLWWVLTRQSRGVWMCVPLKNLIPRQLQSWWNEHHAKGLWVVAAQPVEGQAPVRTLVAA